MSDFVSEGYYRQIQRLQAALADAEALEMGTAETLAKAQVRIKELEETNTQLREGYSVMNKDWLKIQDEKVEQAARIKALEDALLEARNWFESQAKATSKGCPSSWELMELREERDKINELIGE